MVGGTMRRAAVGTLRQAPMVSGDTDGATAMSWRQSVRMWCALAVAASMAVVAGCSTVGSTRPAEVKAALEAAGANRGELARVLAHYRERGDAQKLAAAEFLIGNLEGHGYVTYELRDSDGGVIPFEALDHGTYAAARAELERLEAEHGTLDFKRKELVEDLEVITAEHLIENIDLAFEAWRAKPWAEGLTFEAFCRYVLPYRGSNEPLGRWRAACLERYNALLESLSDPTSRTEAARRIQRDVHEWVRFDEVYYLHPTDQGFEEMCRSGHGRCEDISNMMSYAMRANAIATATDYTPYWADRDNNHAWEVVLDERGEGCAGLSNRAAKIYRKTFELQRENLAFVKREGESAPRWLGGKSYVDVTGQYLETTDVEVELTQAPPAGTRFAYLCVFNGGEWKAIHWSLIGEDRATFTDMGRDIAYLPGYYIDGAVVPAGPPFVLTKAGVVEPLVADKREEMTIEVGTTAPETPDADTGVARPRVVVQAGTQYELFVWHGGWESLGTVVSGEERVLIHGVPRGGLYWMVAEGSRRLERIFTIEAGRQVWW